jgi:hypothetical protein
LATFHCLEPVDPNFSSQICASLDNRYAQET